jgi:hypothetical protein
MSSDNRKVGVVTLPGRFNYGNRLQNYAVQRIWEELGYEPESLVLGERPNAVRTAKRLAKRLMGRKVTDPESLMSPERLAAFDRFNGNITTRCLDSIEPDLRDEYALFSVGSDQVWNLAQITYNDDWYFLEFARPEQRVALAPSIGLDSLDAGQARRLARGVRGFDHPSVREQRGAELIKECSGIDAEVICDPTLMLAPEDWRSVSDGRLTPSEPYVFAYLLGGVSDDARKVLGCITEHGRLRVIPLSDREKPEEPPAGPAEFIDLVDHASHVVTDSFHAAVFSCLMETPLTIVRRGGDGGGMFSRLETLTKTLGIEEKVYGAEGFDLSVAGDYAGVSGRIQCERDHFLSYLRGKIGI